MKTRWTACALTMAASMQVGCAFITPTTEIRFNPVAKSLSIINTKDVDLSFDSLHVEWQEGSGKLDMENVVIADKSSPVIKENVQQMLAFAEQQKAANEGLIGTIRELGAWLREAREIVGILKDLLRGSNLAIDTPYGGGSATLGTRPGP
ncbi:MAG TPA: hypothetical protein VMY42_26405 [Thermoguttaceae bacterium]|nr:hypothetical protein [Thermoguttaceae bacterium]